MMEKVSPEYEMKQLDKCRRAKTRSYAILSHCPLPLWAGDNNNKVASPAAVRQQLGSSGFCWHFCFGPSVLVLVLGHKDVEAPAKRTAGVELKLACTYNPLFTAPGQSSYP